MEIWKEPDAYNPFFSPLFLPVAKQIYSCRFHEFLQLPSHEGATPGTLVNGCFRGIILAHACRESRLFGSEDVHALQEMLVREDFPAVCMGTEFHCAQPGTCACEDLHRRRCSWQPGRVLPPVVRISAPRLWEPDPVREWEMEITLLGRRAIRHAELITRLAHLMGRVGLRVEGKQQTFEVKGPMETYSGCIGGELHPVSSPAASPESPHPAGPDSIVIPDSTKRLLLELATPLLLKPARRGRKPEYMEPDGELHPARLLGNMTFDLCALDMEDREDAPAIQSRRVLCEAARAMVQTMGLNIRVLAVQLHPARHGARMSRSNQCEIRLDGHFGHMILRCPPDTLPWIRALGHWRAGQLASKGFGDIRLWWG